MRDDVRLVAWLPGGLCDDEPDRRGPVDGGALIDAPPPIEQIAVAETHPAQVLADKVRRHLWKRGYRCATAERQRVVPAFRHIAFPAGGIAEQRFDGSIVVSRSVLRGSKVYRVRGGLKYDQDTVDTFVHEYLHLCRPDSSGWREEGMVTIAAEIEARAFCAHRLRVCPTPPGLYYIEFTNRVRDEMVGWHPRRSLISVRRWLNGKAG